MRGGTLDGCNLKELRPYAKKYIWWKTPDEAVEFPNRVIAQVMDIGTFEDAQALLGLVGAPVFRDVLQHAEAGQFSKRSWTYWHYKLGLAKTETDIPPLPQRSF